MFSGPDFLYADAFYSQATTYVLSALEPAGSVPDLARLPRASVGAALYNVERSMSSILNFSFFITKSMKLDLHDGQLNGAIPILYVFLARSGKTIRDVSPIALDEKGAVIGANDSRRRNITQGVRIVFAGSDGREKTLYYFATDLSNSSVRASGFLKFCDTLGLGRQSAQERVLSALQPQFLNRARVLARPQRLHHSGRFRNSACLLRQHKMAALSVRALRGADRRVPRPVSAEIRRAVHPSAADGFRNWLPLAPA